MRIIVKYFYAVLFAEQLKPAACKPVFAERGGDRSKRGVERQRNRGRAERVHYVVVARHSKRDAPKVFAAEYHVERRISHGVIRNALRRIIGIGYAVRVHSKTGGRGVKKLFYALIIGAPYQHTAVRD